MNRPVFNVPDEASDEVALLEAAGVLAPDASAHCVVTHGAVIVLNGSTAWKFKRTVRYRYLDFSTVERRRTALASEYQLNLRTAPDLYQGVHALTRKAGGVELDGSGEVIEYVLEMARFDDDALLAHYADSGRLDDGLLSALADQVAGLHARAEVCGDHRGADRILEVVTGNLASMSRYPEILDPEAAEEVTVRQQEVIELNREVLDARARAGRVRHGHGDLHLANIVVLDRKPVLFDCLEFDSEYATTDVLYDLAFILMDLWQRGLRREANRVANAYFDASPVDEDAFHLLAMFMSVRATVRAHVGAAAGDLASARHHLGVARDLLADHHAAVVAIGGGSGTGKSTLARVLGGDLGAAPGSRIIRSDVLRKQLAGVSELDALPPSAYTGAGSERVYRELCRRATSHVDAGVSVIADAVFGRPAERASIEEVAAGLDRPFSGIWLELDEEGRVERVAGRGPDASDADESVVRRQTTTIVPPGQEWTHLDATAQYSSADLVSAGLLPGDRARPLR